MNKPGFGIHISPSKFSLPTRRPLGVLAALAAAALALGALFLMLLPARARAAWLPGAADPWRFPLTAAPQGTIITSDITTHTTWTLAGSPYQLNNIIHVSPGITLTIQPGVQVLANTNQSLWVFGNLKAEGSAAQPILFSGVSQTPGSWGGLHIGYLEQQPSNASLRYVTIEYGGPNLPYYYGNLMLDDSHVTISHCTFRYGAGNGVAVDLAADLLMSDSAIVDNALTALVFTQPGNNDPALSNLTVSGNGRDAILYYAIYLEGAHTIENVGLPVFLEGNFSVAQAGSLSVAPGVTLLAEYGLSVAGKLDAPGTASQPITITGSTNTPGSWAGVRVYGVYGQPAHARLDHVLLEYGGFAANNAAGNLVVSSAVVTVTNSMIRNGGRHGIVSAGGSPLETISLVVENTQISGNGGDAVSCQDESCHLDLVSLAASGNELDAVVYRSTFLTGDQTWKNIHLPYRIEDGLWLDGILTIEPGVEVVFTQDTYLDVDGALFAVGTPTQPITFTASQPTPGWWQGIRMRWPAMVALENCDIGYGGGQNHELVEIIIHAITISGCRLHHSSGPAIRVRYGSWPYLRNNRFENNAFGLVNIPSGDPVVVDARDNWWGSPSGPTHASNPGGSGQAVSDHVLFDPWLTDPGQTGAPTGFALKVLGPNLFSPGQRATYSVYYRNAGSEPVQDTVLRFLLPNDGEYLAGSPGAVSWLERAEVFWKLGDLAPGEAGVVWVELRFAWGLPIGIKQVVAAQAAGGNLAPALFDHQPYLAYTPRSLTSRADLSPQQVQAELDAYPALKTLHDQALAAGYQLAFGEQRSYSTGMQDTLLFLLRAQPRLSALRLYRQPAGVTAIEIDGASFTVRQAGQGVRWSWPSGEWEPVSGSLLPNAPQEGISWSECMKNCILEKLPGYLIEKAIDVLDTGGNILSCIQFATGDEDAMLGCAKTLDGLAPGVGEGIELGLCNKDCQDCEAGGLGCDDDRCHCCKTSKYRCSSDDFPYGWFGIDVIKMRKCDLNSGKYLAETTIKLCDLCQKCIEAPSGPACVDKNMPGNLRLPSASLVVAPGSDQECDECRAARDPNAMHGPQGALLPGQWVTNTVEYENVGQGWAYDVFIANPLSEHFDLGTLHAFGNATFSASARSLYWQVGDLAPAGQVGSSGSVSYTVRLKPDLASGTVISNQAVVHFPTVPERTPTNVLVNVIHPLAATPLVVETQANTPVAFTLQGQDAAGAPLTFALLEAPLFGSLGGSPPTLVYTPTAGFSGYDRLTFSASNAITTSYPAEVTLLVHPDPDETTPPQVLWAAPAGGATVTVTGEGLPGASGLLYLPQLQVRFSEAMSATTITSQTIQVRLAGQLVPAEVRYDEVGRRAVLLLAAAPVDGGLYSVTVTSGAQDLAGNPLASAYILSFQVRVAAIPGASSQVYLPVMHR